MTASLLQSLCLDIGGITFRVDLPSAAWHAALAARYAAFPGAAAPLWQVTAREDPGLDTTAEPWIDHDGPVTAFRVSDNLGRVDLDTRRAEIALPSAERAGSGLDRILSYICMQVLPREGLGLLLHGCAVAVVGPRAGGLDAPQGGRLGGGGYVFTGASGAGKTTVARLAAGHADVLTDENLIIRFAGGHGPELCSTPFWGQSTPAELIRRTNRRVPLRAVFLLEHTPGFQLSPLAPAEAVMALLTTEKVSVERIDSAAHWLAAAGRLIREAPVYRLGFAPTAELWDFLSLHRSG